MVENIEEEIEVVVVQGRGKQKRMFNGVELCTRLQCVKTSITFLRIAPFAKAEPGCLKYYLLFIVKNVINLESCQRKEINGNVYLDNASQLAACGNNVDIHLEDGT